MCETNIDGKGEVGRGDYRKWLKEQNLKAGRRSAEKRTERSAERLQQLIEHDDGERMEVRQTHAVRVRGVRRTIVPFELVDGPIEFRFVRTDDGNVPCRVMIDPASVEGMTVSLQLELHADRLEDEKEARRSEREAPTPADRRKLHVGRDETDADLLAAVVDGADDYRVAYFHDTLREALAQLPDVERRCFEAIYFEGRPKGEVAREVLHRSNSTLTYRMGVVLGKIEAYLRRKGIDADYFG